MSRTRMSSSTGCYHVVLRGNGKQLIFEDDSDRNVFLDLLARYSAREHITLIAWCLMSNHVHLCLMLDDPDETGRLSKFMQVLEASYAERFNWKTGHVGHVFQSRFESMPIEDEGYLLEAVRYIHNNPEKAGICPASEYWWSSHHEYLGYATLCDTRPVLDALGGIEGFKKFSQAKDAEPYLFISGRRIRDADMLETAHECLGDMTPREVKGLPKPARDEKLIALRTAGLSVRQIERLTGIGKATITRVTKNASFRPECFISP